MQQLQPYGFQLNERPSSPGGMNRRTPSPSSPGGMNRRTPSPSSPGGTSKAQVVYCNIFKTHLPDELVIYLIQFLNYHSQLAFSQSCREARSVCLKSILTARIKKKAPELTYKKFQRLVSLIGKDFLLTATHLHLSKLDCLPHLFTILKACHSLNTLCIEGNIYPTKRTIATLASCSPDLFSLSLDIESPIAPEIFKAIKVYYPYLRSLSYSTRSLHTSELISAIKNLSYLKELHLTSVKEEDNHPEILRAVESCTQLQTLSLHQFTWSEEILQTLFLKCLKMQQLNISNTFLGEGRLRILANSSPNLTELACGIGRIDSSERRGLEQIAKYCTNLQKIVFLCSGNVSDEEIFPVLHQCLELRTLYLLEQPHVIPRITDAILNAIGTNCPNLKSLLLGRLPLITKEAIDLLQEIRPSLHIAYNAYKTYHKGSRRYKIKLGDATHVFYALKMQKKGDDSSQSRNLPIEGKSG